MLFVGATAVESLAAAGDAVGAVEGVPT